MDQPHDTLESQLRLKKQGLLATGIIILGLIGWLVYGAVSPAPPHDPAIPHSVAPTTDLDPSILPDHDHPGDPHTTDEPAASGADHTDQHAAHEPEDGHHGDDANAGDGHAESGHEDVGVPAAYSVLPFVALLLCIAILPLSRRTEHWWEKNLNRLSVAAGLGLVTLAYYAFLFPHGVHDHITHAHSDPGLAAAWTVLKNALLSEYIPFITLLFSLYVITGGIVIEGRLAGTPLTNAGIIAVGALLASFVGTTGAAMLLIRPLLSANIKRKYVAHTVIFFIFAVCNTGGCLLPIGDPPLFLGFLRGVDFFWTLNLWKPWLFTNVAIIVIYAIYDLIVSRKESADSLTPARTDGPLLGISGKLNLVWLAGIILCVATLDPSKPFPGTDWHAPLYFREFLMYVLTLCSIGLTSSAIRLKNTFNYDAILEVAALFSGIFICMQAPVQILNVYGKSLGFETAPAFFWGTGFLSSFLDNAPTYVVFFETARTMEPVGATVAGVSEVFLVAISLGAVFMGAMTYIGNGPNFMVKAIAEKNNIRMPSFFGYMMYSFTVLIPVFVVMSLIFL